MRKENNTNERQNDDSISRIIGDRFSKYKTSISPDYYSKEEHYIFSVKPVGYDYPINVILQFPKPSIGQERDLESVQPFQSAFAQEQRAFNRMLPELLQELSGKYVALFGGVVIDQDSSEIRLAERIESSHHSEFVLIRKVSKEKTTDYLESPEEEFP
jgi:hypothetical protein